MVYAGNQPLTLSGPPSGTAKLLPGPTISPPENATLTLNLQRILKRHNPTQSGFSAKMPAKIADLAPGKTSVWPRGNAFTPRRFDAKIDCQRTPLPLTPTTIARLLSMSTLPSPVLLQFHSSMGANQEDIW